MNKVAFIDLQAQRRRLGNQIEDALARVLEHGQYVMGPEIAACESRLAEFCGAQHVVTCGSGTQALHMAMRALGVVPGDAVFVPAFTFVAPAEMVAMIGATPIFVDVRENDFNMDPASLEAAIATAKHEGLRPVGVIPVDLFGQPADYPAIKAVAERHGLFVLGDAAQSFGATLDGAGVGTLADVTTTSFFPAKPL
ncbi:MAG: aminotransferase class I/II-fold pyridoxal phosphate-dependent enzyme, partial [Hyphomicrobiales bacterium]|nr:aminotransferase class I/II-fold pyridoxal phosphate-dependent enzyme [Hyphomicrobiales bacterium]